MKMSWKSGLVVTALVAATGIGAWWWSQQQHNALPVDAQYTLIDGTPGALAQWRGQVVLVNFWATSCTTCVSEMPKLIEMHQKFNGQGFATVAVAMSYDNPDYVQNFVKTRGLPFPVAYDKSGEVAKTFADVQLTPTTFLLNKKGEIVKRYVGAPDFEALQQLIGRLIQEG